MNKFIPIGKCLSIKLIIICFPAVGTAQYDFTLSHYGPSTAIQGHHNYTMLQSQLTEGDGTYAYVSFKDLPPYSEIDVHSARIHCCGFKDGVARLYRPGNAEIRITPSMSTPPGIYPIQFVVESGGVTKTLRFDLTVLAPPLPLARHNPGSEVSPIPELSRWENQMISFGEHYCDFDRFPNMGQGWEGDVWYYDGAWVFYQIGSYTNNPSKWNACGDGVLKVYRQWILDVTMQGWRVFPHGITAHRRRTGDALSLDALKRLVSHTSYGNQGGHISPPYIRETAYMLHSYRLNLEEGQPHHYYQYPSSPQNAEYVPGVERSAAFLLGHLQHFLEKKESRDWSDRFCPFMKGLAMHALIEYYQYRLEAEQIADARIPSIIAEIADLIWEESWVEKDESFFYEWYPDTPPRSSGAPDLNLLIAPAYAWLWQMTGEERFKERGDKAFAGGVRKAWLGSGKHFSQNYRWSFDYVKWRSTLPAWAGIQSVKLERVTGTSATISWTTKQPTLAAAEFGKTTQHLSQTELSKEPATVHRLTIEGLTPSTTYHFRATAWDKSHPEHKRFVSEFFNFATAPGNHPNPPVRLRQG